MEAQAVRGGNDLSVGLLTLPQVFKCGGGHYKYFVGIYYENRVCEKIYGVYSQ